MAMGHSATTLWYLLKYLEILYAFLFEIAFLFLGGGGACGDQFWDYKDISVLSKREASHSIRKILSILIMGLHFLASLPLEITFTKKPPSNPSSSQSPSNGVAGSSVACRASVLIQRSLVQKPIYENILWFPNSWREGNFWSLMQFAELRSSEGVGIVLTRAVKTKVWVNL